MRVFIIAFLVQVMAGSAMADTDAVTSAAEEAKPVRKQQFPTTATGAVKASPFQQYNIQAQCARLAELAGRDKEAADHLKAAKAIKPKEVPESDISYRYGFVDGSIANEWNRNRGRFTMKALALATHKAVCPVLM